jgi:hypothetical protein
MHGIIFFELKKFVDAKLPEGSWEKILADAGVHQIYLPTAQYPDAEVVTLVGAASRLAKTSAQNLLLGFGEFIAPDLLAMYQSLLKPSWRTLDVIENTETVMHTVVRLRNPGARPPVLRATRVSPSEVELRYGSPRKMCSIAKGISKGIAAHFGEKLEIEDRSCMLEGAPECVIRLRLAPA